MPVVAELLRGSCDAAGRRRLAAALAVVLALLSASSCRRDPGNGTATAAAPATGARPSFVVVVLDDLDLRLGSPAELPRTRQLIAERGLELASHFVSTPLCCPSRVTLLTGQYTHNHRVFRNRGRLGGFHRFQRLGLEGATLALALQQGGYRTALIGKYLNEYSGSHVPAGWDRWVAAGASAYNGFGYSLTVDGGSERHRAAAADYVTDVLAGHAEAFLAQQRPGSPFFLYLAPLAPHPPATPAPRHAALFADRVIPRTPAFNEADVADKAPSGRRPPLAAGEIAALDEHYRQRLRSLRAVDEAIERLDAALARGGLAGETYVVVTSDNGFHMGQHRLPFGKGTAFEEDVHVPLYVRGPGVRVGERDDRLSTGADLPVTIADLAGVSLPAADGRSLRPLWTSSSEVPWRRLVLVENFQAGDAEEATAEAPAAAAAPAAGDGESDAFPRVSAIRGATQKYVELDDGKWAELYRLDEDPHELRSVAGCLTASARQELADLLHAMAACKGEACRRIEERDWPPLRLEETCPQAP